MEHQLLKSNQDFQKTVTETDKFLQENFPPDQHFIYTERGHAIIFKKPFGFNTDDERRGEAIIQRIRRDEDSRVITPGDSGHKMGLSSGYVQGENK